MRRTKQQAQNQDNGKTYKRRVNTQCNYSIFMTSSMNFLKHKDIYLVSKQLVEKNSISKQKNYSIIFLRLALYFYLELKQNSAKKEILILDMIKWFNRQIHDCLNIKYGNLPKNFYKLVKKKVFHILKVIEKVFSQDDLTNFLNTKTILLDLYDAKPNKTYSKNHERNAGQLAKIIIGVLEHGENYMQTQKSISSFETFESVNFSQENTTDWSSKISFRNFNIQNQIKENSTQEIVQQTKLISLDLNQEIISVDSFGQQFKYFLSPQELSIVQPFPEFQLEGEDRYQASQASQLI